MKKILFITAPYHAGVVEVAGKWVPLYMVTLAGACRVAGHECKIYDAMTKGTDIDEICMQIDEFQPDVVAVSMITSTVVDSLRVVSAAKEINSSITTIAGGIHATFMYEDLLHNDSLDFVVIGEGENTLAELVDCLDNDQKLQDVKGIAYFDQKSLKVTPQRQQIDNLDNMPMAWDLLDWDDYTYFIIPGSRLGAVATSRGCTYTCTFCSQHKFWRESWRARSAVDVVNEIEILHTDYAVNVVLFTDDYPTPDQQRWEEILDLLIAKKLDIKLLMETRAEDIIRDKDILWKYRQAGIIHIYIGTESNSQSMLDMMKKELSVAQSKEALNLCRRHNIITETSMIIGFPEDTPDSVQETIRQAQDFNPDFAHFLAIAPWPYADLFKELEPYIEESDFRKYNLVDPIIKPKNMTREQIDRAIIDGYRLFYMGKFEDILQIEDTFKRNYMLTAVKRMMQHSFIRKKLGSLDQEMPEEMKRLINLESPGISQPTPHSKQ